MACSVDVAGASSAIGDSGAQFAIVAWAALGIVALLWSVACCSPDAEKKLSPGRLGAWFLTWAGVTVLVGDLGRPAFAWTVAGQLLLACSGAAASSARHITGSVAAAASVVLWGVTAALGYALVATVARHESGDDCARYRRAVRATAGAAAAVSIASIVSASVAASARRRTAVFDTTLPH